MKYILLLLSIVSSIVCNAQHGFEIGDSTTAINIINSHNDQKSLIIYIQSITEKSDSTIVGATLLFYSDSINYLLGVNTNCGIYTLPINSNYIEVMLPQKAWVTMPQVINYLKNVFQRAGFGIIKNIN